MMKRVVVGKIGQSITKLKPCPFCGSRAELRETSHYPNGIDYHPRCTDASCPGRGSKKYKSKELAITKWNARDIYG